MAHSLESNAIHTRLDMEDDSMHDRFHTPPETLTTIAVTPDDDIDDVPALFDDALPTAVPVDSPVTPWRADDGAQRDAGILSDAAAAGASDIVDDNDDDNAEADTTGGQEHLLSQKHGGRTDGRVVAKLVQKNMTPRDPIILLPLPAAGARSRSARMSRFVRLSTNEEELMRCIQEFAAT